MSSNYIPSMTCAFHPNRETLLRCNRCERPICTSCAIQTPTGYRCKECIRIQQKVFETARSTDHILAFMIPVILSFFGSFLASMLGFFTIIIAPISGVITAEAVRWSVHRRRSKLLFQLAAMGAVLGSLPIIMLDLLPFLFSLGSDNPAWSLYSILTSAWQGLYTFLIASTVYYRLSGIQIR